MSYEEDRDAAIARYDRGVTEAIARYDRGTADAIAKYKRNTDEAFARFDDNVARAKRELARKLVPVYIGYAVAMIAIVVAAVCIICRAIP